MAGEKTRIRELLDAQLKLKEAILTEISYINVTLDQPDIKITTQNDLRDRRDQLADQYGTLRIDSVQIIAAETVGDIETINAVSADVQQFIRSIKQVAKAIKITSAFIVFVAACLAKNPKTIADAAVALYKTMNEKIAEESLNGPASALMIAPFQAPKSIKALMMP